MEGRLLSIAETGEGDVRAWEELAAHAAEPNPLFEPACLVPAARHLPGGGELLLAVAEDRGVLAGCVPVVRKPAGTIPSVSWPGFGRAVLSTQVRRLRYDGTPLVLEGRGEAAFVAMLSALQSYARASRAGVLVFEAMSSDGEVALQLSSAANRLRIPIHVACSYERPVMRRRPQNIYREMHQAKARQNWRRQERQLGAKLGGPVELVDRSGDRAAVTELLRLEALGYKGRKLPDAPDCDQGSAPGIAFSCWPGEPEWFMAMCDDFRRKSRLFLYSLEAAGHVLAMQLMVRGGPGLFELVTSFDEDYALYSPGQLLKLKALEWIHERTDVAWIDSCTYEGNQTYGRLYPDRHLVSTFLLGLGGIVDRTCLALEPSWRAARLVSKVSRKVAGLAV